MERGKALETPANRKWFLEQITAGADPEKAAEALGTSVRSVQRYAKENSPFKRLYDQAKRNGRVARKNATAEIELAPLPGEQEGAVARVYLEEVQKALPEGLKLNPHLPPLSVESFLGKCQALLYDDKAPVPLRIAALKQIGAHTLFPALRSSMQGRPSSEVDDEPISRPVIPGSGPQVVVLIAPDNGMYAPGCGPSQARVVDDDEADNVQALTVEAKPVSTKPRGPVEVVEVIEERP